MTRDPPLADSMSAGVIDRAETFAESDVSLSGSGYNVADESVELGLGDGYVYDPSEYTTENTLLGVQLTPSQDLLGVTGTLTSGEMTRVQLYNADDGTLLEESTSTDFTFTTPLSAGTTYNIVADAEGADYNSANTGTGSNPSYPSDEGSFTVEGGADGATGSMAEVYNVDTLDVLRSDATAFLGYDHPADIYRWDSVLFQRSPDSETVTIDVQESSDGGSTWTTIATDVSRGQEITADPANEVRFKVNISRSDAANNPTLDAAYRRYVV